MRFVVLSIKYYYYYYHCNQWGVCGIVVHESIELPFGVMHGVIPGTKVLDGVHVPQRKERVWGVLGPLV